MNKRTTSMNLADRMIDLMDVWTKRLTYVSIFLFVSYIVYRS